MIGVRFNFCCLALSMLVLAVSVRCASAQDDTTHNASSERFSRELVDHGKASIKRGVDWLLRQQAADGGWRSTTYSHLRGGSGNTALAIYALSHLPSDERESLEFHIDRALQFLLSQMAADGSVGTLNGSADYPTYATALTLSAMERMHLDGWITQRRRMREYLHDAQKRDRANQLNRGGWGQVGGSFRGQATDDPPTIAATQFVLEALHRSGGIQKETERAALAFLANCQILGSDEVVDGGFFFTPLPNDPLNKAGPLQRPGVPLSARPYGTATADGLCALLACGVPQSDLRVRAAKDWLQLDTRLEAVPGFATADAQVPSTQDGLLFYYYAALARAIDNTPEAKWTPYRIAILKSIIGKQRPDGSWSNSCGLMKEDDPLVATCFAVEAMTTVSNAHTTLE